MNLITVLTSPRIRGVAGRTESRRKPCRFARDYNDYAQLPGDLDLEVIAQAEIPMAVVDSSNGVEIGFIGCVIAGERK